jgi:DeoR family ulaG and ulaABCDEF operon transcriptional repressor
MSEFTPTPERQKQILSLLTKQGRLSVTEIVEQFSISEATARRDLESLASQGKANAYMAASSPWNRLRLNCPSFNVKANRRMKNPRSAKPQQN